MELKQYWNVIWRRRWLVLAIVLVVAAVSAFLAFTAKKSYQTDVRFITRQEPSPDNPSAPGVTGPPTDLVFTFNRYYNWFGSEFLVDDYTQITTSDAFAGSVLDTMNQPFFAEKVMEDLNKQARASGTSALRGSQDTERLKTDISKLRMEDVKGGIESDRKHRELRVSLKGPSMEVTKAMGDAAGIVLADAKLKPIRGQMVDDKAVFTQIDNPGPANIQSSRSKDIINAVIRIAIGLVVALALAFLLECLDNSVRDEQDAQRTLDLPVIGAIPRV